MKRVLIAIGCDKYEHLSPLSGAENDASTFFNCLTSGQHAAYDQELSLLLLSPTTPKIQGAISDAELHSHEIETLTFFFAGHGVLKSGSFWMCTTETDGNKLATTAYSLSNLFLMIQEIHPRQANIVIDACESGGVLADIRASLRATEIGDANTTGINILAACAKNQYATELNGAGICTTAVIACIEGTTYVHDNAPGLSLSEIATKISEQRLATQDPVFWGLNISGTEKFCSNPHFNHEAPFRRAIAAPHAAQAGPKVRSDIWKAYLDLDDGMDCQQLGDALSKVIDQEHLHAFDRINIARQVSAGLSLRARSCRDPFREIEAQATCASRLLPYCDNDEIRDYAINECNSISRKVISAAALINSQLRSNRFALLGRSAHPELYFLPIRIAKLGGWIGAALHAAREPADIEPIEELFTSIVTSYPLSCSAVSDIQAPYVLAMLTGLARSGLNDLSETVCSLLFMSFCDLKGCIATPSAKPSEIVTYLFMRATGDFTTDRELLSRPTELSTVLLLCSKMLRLGETFDESMIDLDRHSINAFVPNSYMDYAKQRIEAGDNYTFKIGFDIWTTGDLHDHWERLEKPKPENNAVASLSTFSSLLYPDRTCWHLLEVSESHSLALNPMRATKTNH